MDQNNALDFYLSAITALIEEGDLDAALETLKKMESEFKVGLAQDITMQMGTYARVKRQSIAGTISSEEFTRQANRTQYNILELLKQAPKKLDLNARLKGLPGASSVQIDTTDFEKLVSPEALLKISWIEKALGASKAVCRIIFKDGRAEGTGFLTEGNYLYTNNHVIDTAAKAQGMLAQFNFEFGADNQMRETVTYEFDTSDFFTSAKTVLDCTRIKLKDRADKPLRAWGYLKLSPQAVPAVGQPVNIIQHPGGRDKEIALRANEVVKVQSPFIHYRTNTEGGSSGAPVFNQNWEVVALHHSYRASLNANEGVLFRDILGAIAAAPSGSGSSSRGADASESMSSTNTSSSSAQISQPASVVAVPSGGPVRFLILYDVADEPFNETLCDFLTPAVRNKKVMVRSLHRDADAGDPMEFAKSEAAQADYLLCLITRKFNISEWLPFALESGKKIIPIRVTSVEIKETGLERFASLPTQGRTVPAFKDDDAAFSDIAKVLLKLGR